MSFKIIPVVILLFVAGCNKNPVNDKSLSANELVLVGTWASCDTLILNADGSLRSIFYNGISGSHATSRGSGTWSADESSLYITIESIKTGYFYYFKEESCCDCDSMIDGRCVGRVLARLTLTPYSNQNNQFDFKKIQ